MRCLGLRGRAPCLPCSRLRVKRLLRLSGAIFRASRFAGAQVFQLVGRVTWQVLYGVCGMSF